MAFGPPHDRLSPRAVLHLYGDVVEDERTRFGRDLLSAEPWLFCDALNNSLDLKPSVILKLVSALVWRNRKSLLNPASLDFLQWPL